MDFTEVDQEIPHSKFNYYASGSKFRRLKSAVFVLLKGSGEGSVKVAEAQSIG